MNILEHNTGLKKEVIEKIQGCFAQFPEIEKVLLYGSRAKGNYRRGSDIDLCIVGKDASTDTVFKVSNQLDDLLLPYTFDLSIYHLLDNQNFIEHIDRVGVVFYEKP